MGAYILFKPALVKPQIWLNLGWLEVALSYRRTFFGPLWITFNLAIFSLVMTLVYGALFGVPAPEYGAFITSGMIAWTWIAGLLTESGNVFINYCYFVRNTSINKVQFVWASAYKQFIVFMHNMIVIGILLIFSFVPVTIYSFLIIPGMLLIFLFSIPLIAAFAILFARYRDLQKLTNSGIVVLMMITPIFWNANMIEGWRSLFVYWNPIYYLIEILRQPLLGNPVEWRTFGVVIAMTAVAWLISSVFYQRYERYVVFWI